jgi:glycosyltransferase involved in cell wall biosynthesis
VIRARARTNDAPQLTVSACIITRDEADRIAECLTSLDFCDELLVVDCGSRDGTQQLARELGARVIEQQWMGHVAQKEFATRAARNDWVLFADADERVSDALREEILERQADGFCDAAGYDMPRLSRYRGKWIRHGAWYPNRQLRLFDRRRGRWGGINPHDRVVLDGQAGKLRSDLLHIPYRTMREQLETMDEYTSIAARELLKRGCPFAGPRLILNPPFRVIRSLFLKLGFLDGRRGLLLALMEARYAYLKYRKLHTLRREASARVSEMRAGEVALETTR